MADLITGEEAIKRMVSVLQGLDNIGDVSDAYNAIVGPSPLIRIGEAWTDSRWPLWAIEAEED